MKLSVDLTLPADANPVAVADWVLDLLANQVDAPYASCDSVEPDPWPTGGESPR